MRADCTAAAGVGSSGIVARVLSLITVALTVGLADSLNQSKVGPALYLAIDKKAVRRVAVVPPHAAHFTVSLVDDIGT